jgi:hypothetical protein
VASPNVPHPFPLLPATGRKLTPTGPVRPPCLYPTNTPNLPTSDCNLALRNCRDIAEHALKYVRGGCVFRCSQLHTAPLRAQLGISSIIDLRSGCKLGAQAPCVPQKSVRTKWMKWQGWRGASQPAAVAPCDDCGTMLSSENGGQDVRVSLHCGRDEVCGDKGGHCWCSVASCCGHKGSLRIAHLVHLQLASFHARHPRTWTQGRLWQQSMVAAVNSTVLIGEFCRNTWFAAHKLSNTVTLHTCLLHLLPVPPTGEAGSCRCITWTSAHLPSNSPSWLQSHGAQPCGRS